MFKLISKRGNWCAPGLDRKKKFLKLERESAGELIIEMMIFMIIKRKISRI
jgi:hypothetical protein